jgi:bacillithiol system protein YtxJ
MALKQFEKEFDLEATQIDNYFLDLLNFREISNKIGEHFAVQHQSPQLILIQNGQTMYHVSHSDIDASALKQFLQK